MCLPKHRGKHIVQSGKYNTPESSQYKNLDHEIGSLTITHQCNLKLVATVFLSFFGVSPTVVPKKVNYKGDRLHKHAGV
ncbi:hypothetical protein SDC9_99827 [bioreactor metagenome]|uniref:Uncharacterized protein n=1 Tax=bioreactor metagenome TaxID=1076179 RepID=A0A645AQD3_9ZZZZ